MDACQPSHQEAYWQLQMLVGWSVPWRKWCFTASLFIEWTYRPELHRNSWKAWEEILCMSKWLQWPSGWCLGLLIGGCLPLLPLALQPHITLPCVEFTVCSPKWKANDAEMLCKSQGPRQRARPLLAKHGQQQQQLWKPDGVCLVEVWQEASRRAQKRPSKEWNAVWQSWRARAGAEFSEIKKADN